MYKQLRYNSFNTHLREKFGGKVYKISLDAGFSCPNREQGGGCIYCDSTGSGTGAFSRNIPVQEQMRAGIERYRKKYRADKFIAYFQAFTNTYLPVDELKNRYDSALGFDEVVGLFIGTRPDCIDEAKLALIEQYTNRYYVWIEYGMQSSHDRTLAIINRGHTVADLVRAVEMTKNRGIHICVHVILGLPGESHDDMMETACAVAKMGVDGIKIHLLHVVKGSPLEELYYRGELALMDKATYVNTVCDFLERLPENILIQRLTGERHPDILVAPTWCLDKSMVLNEIQAELVWRDSYQGKNCTLC